MVTGDDPVIDLLDLFRGEPGADGFDDVLVVTLAVEAAVDRVIIDTCEKCGIVIVNNCEVLGFVILDDY